METSIKLKPSEINENLLLVLKKFLNGRDNFEITINVKELTSSDFLIAEDKEEYQKQLSNAINNIEKESGLVSFTFEEFETFSTKLLNTK